MCEINEKYELLQAPVTPHSLHVKIFTDYTFYGHFVLSIFQVF